MKDLVPHQDSCIDKMIEYCKTPEHFNSMVNLLRNSNISKKEKTIWFSMLKEKAKSNDINLGELYEA